MTEQLAEYRGEFRFVFYTGENRYEETLRFYTDVLGFRVVGGFGQRGELGYSEGTYLQASAGVIEIIAAADDDVLRLILTGSKDPYAPPQEGVLLIEVPDVDALAGSVERSGVPLFQAMCDWPWKFRDFKVRDPCGNIVCCFSRLEGWETHHGGAER